MYQVAGGSRHQIDSAIHTWPPCCHGSEDRASSGKPRRCWTPRRAYPPGVLRTTRQGLVGPRPLDLDAVGQGSDLNSWTNWVPNCSQTVSTATTIRCLTRTVFWRHFGTQRPAPTQKTKKPLARNLGRDDVGARWTLNSTATCFLILRGQRAAYF